MFAVTVVIVLRALFWAHNMLPALNARAKSWTSKSPGSPWQAVTSHLPLRLRNPVPAEAVAILVGRARARWTIWTEVFGRSSRSCKAGERFLLLIHRDRRFRHSSAVISQISAMKCPETKSRSSMATTRMPCFSEILRDAVFATALGIRSTGNFRTLNQ